MSAPGKPSPASRENGKLGGRPAGTVASATLMAQEFRKALAEHIMKDKDKWMRAMDPLVFPENGDKPDVAAWEKVMARAFGKPQEHVDVTTNGETMNVPMTPAVMKIAQEFEEKMKNVIMEEAGEI